MKSDVGEERGVFVAGLAALDRIFWLPVVPQLIAGRLPALMNPVALPPQG